MEARLIHVAAPTVLLLLASCDAPSGPGPSRR